MHFIVHNSSARAENNVKLLRIDVHAAEKGTDERNIGLDWRRDRTKPVDRDVLRQVGRPGGRRAKEMHQLRLGRLSDLDLIDLCLRDARREPRPGR